MGDTAQTITQQSSTVVELQNVDDVDKSDDKNGDIANANDSITVPTPTTVCDTSQQHSSPKSNTKGSSPPSRASSRLSVPSSSSHRAWVRPSTAATASVNPFVNITKYNILFKFKCFVVGIFLLVPRLILFFVALSMLSAVCAIAIIGKSKDQLKAKPIERCWLRFFVRMCARIVLFALGYMWIRKKGKAAKRNIAPIVVANHCTMVDALYFLYDVHCSFVAKAAVAEELPLVGNIVYAIQAILVDRGDRNSQKAVVQEITSRAHAEGAWPRVVIFPEGTTTNQQALITFKLGPFLPGVTVQPAILHYRFCWFDPSYVGRWTSVKLLLVSMCQVVNFLDVHYLPPYTPSPTEKNNPKLFAHNVRQAMSRYLGPKHVIPVTSHSFEDVKLQVEGNRLGMPSRSYAGFAFKKTFPTLSVEDGKHFLQRFAMLDKNHDGVITLDEFHQLLAASMDPGMKILAEDSATVEAIFDLLDTDRDKEMSVRDFFMGMALLNVRAEATPEEMESNLTVAFGLLDADADGFITPDELRAAVNLVISPDSEAADRRQDRLVDMIMSGCDANADGKLDLEEFIQYAVKNPELVIALVSAVKQRAVVRMEDRKERDKASSHQTTKNENEQDNVTKE
eukprot:PhM_4_TR9806/c0_g1_i2/m.46632/K13510/LPCAT1_2; lysophosphatidylcholine acyltransferase / lyso-PAF acetyltransferase